MFTKRGFFGTLPKIWSRIPREIITRGERRGWLGLKIACSPCTKFRTGKTIRESDGYKKHKAKVCENPDLDLDTDQTVIVYH